MNATPQRIALVAESSVSQAAKFVVSALRSGTRRRFLYTFLLSLLWSSIEIASHASDISLDDLSPYVNAILSMQFNGFAVGLALLVADRASVPPLSRIWPYPVAVLLGVAIGTTVMWWFSQHLLGLTTAYHYQDGPEPAATFMFRIGIHGLMICGIAAVAYVLRRRASQRQDALRAMQADSAEVERRVLNLRLAAMQSRVEPRFLLDAVARLENQFEKDSKLGIQMLDDLVAYLRVAIPQIRDPGSTIGREVYLANAFLKVTDHSNGQLLRPVAGAALAADARVPPMLILPLINSALEQRDALTSSENWFEITSTIIDDRLLITISDSSNGFSAKIDDDVRVTHLRERLATLYGSRAVLTFSLGTRGSEATIELPCEIQSTKRATLANPPVEKARHAS
jgi:hypothetical protein